MVNTSTLLMQTLQSNWSLSSPGQTDVYWVDAKVEMMDWAKLGKNIVVACYSASGPVQVVPLSREVFQKTEKVIVDVIVRVLTSVDDTLRMRESMRAEVYRIIETTQFAIEGVANAFVSREPYKVESSELTRLTVEVTCVSFDVTS
jgi:hypothetical protein